MEKINCSRDKSKGKMQLDKAARHNGCSVSNIMDALRQALQDSKRDNKELAAQNAALKEEATENAALRKQAAEKDALAAENAAMKEQLAAAQAALDEQTAQNAALSRRNGALAAENSGLKKLAAENVALKKDMDSTASHLNQARDELVNMLKSVDTARAREEELEKKHEALKTAMKVKEEENVSLSADLQLLRMDKFKEHCCDLEVQFKALQEEYEEKLRSSVLEEEASFHQSEDLKKQITETDTELAAQLEEGQHLMLQNIELQELSLKTDSNKETVEKEKKENKQEKKEQLEREKKEKKREKKEKKWRKWFPCFLFKCCSSS